MATLYTLLRSPESLASLRSPVLLPPSRSPSPPPHHPEEALPISPVSRPPSPPPLFPPLRQARQNSPPLTEHSLRASLLSWQIRLRDLSARLGALHSGLASGEASNWAGKCSVEHVTRCGRACEEAKFVEQALRDAVQWCKRAGVKKIPVKALVSAVGARRKRSNSAPLLRPTHPSFPPSLLSLPYPLPIAQEANSYVLSLPPPPSFRDTDPELLAQRGDAPPLYTEEADVGSGERSVERTEGGEAGEEEYERELRMVLGELERRRGEEEFLIGSSLSCFTSGLVLSLAATYRSRFPSGRDKTPTAVVSVQHFYLFRLYCISNGNKWVVGGIGAVVWGCFGIAIYMFSLTLQMTSFLDTYKTKNVSWGWFGGMLFVDLALSASLTFFLWRRRDREAPFSLPLIAKSAIQTNCISAAFQFAVCVLYSKSESSLVYIYVSPSVVKALNARDPSLDGAFPHALTSLSYSHRYRLKGFGAFPFLVPSSLSTPPPAHFSVRQEVAVDLDNGNGTRVRVREEGDVDSFRCRGKTESMRSSWAGRREGEGEGRPFTVVFEGLGRRGGEEGEMRAF
ncbi:hypothetical protein JCM8547_006649 [Rhodosporidiobolus lusitaniae]